MNRRSKIKSALVIALVLLALSPGALRACSVCYGDPDSGMARGLVSGIGVLLGVVVTVLAGIATFFVYIAKKSPTDKESR